MHDPWNDDRTAPGPHLSPAEAGRGERQGHRIATRLVVGAIVGALVGAVAGLILGAVAFDKMGAVLTSGVAGSIGFGLIGAFWGGMAGLESPDPTREPTQTNHPLGEPPTRVERDPDRVSRPGG